MVFVNLPSKKLAKVNDVQGNFDAVLDSTKTFTSFAVGKMTISQTASEIDIRYSSQTVMKIDDTTKDVLVNSSKNRGATTNYSYINNRIWQKTGLIIPMYIYPANIFSNTSYNTVINDIKTYHNVPAYVILNPASGPGSVTDGNYTAAIQRLHGAGAHVLGYVASNYGATSLSVVKTDIDGWTTYYPEIDGIFVDEMANSSDTTMFTYYENISDYIHEQKYWPSIGNPGADIVEGYFGERGMDNIIIVESATYPSEATLRGGDWDGSHMEYSYKRRGAIVHSQNTFTTSDVALLKKYTSLIYITDDVLANPYDTISSYNANVLQVLSSEPNERITGNLEINGTLSVTGAAGFSSTLSVTGIITGGSDIRTIAWTEYSSLSTISGWSTLSTKKIFYKKVGNTVHVNWNLAGISNAGTANFSLPYTATSLNFEGLLGYTVDNGATPGAPGRYRLLENTATVVCTSNLGLGTWTTANTKTVFGGFRYETI